MPKFIAKCSNQVLCMKPQRVQVVDGIVLPVQGEHIKFENGEYNTADKKEVEFIKAHRLYGNQIFEDKKAAEPEQQ